MKGTLGYGRYNDDPTYIGCPRARSDMTPCAARDGKNATDNGFCVGCTLHSANLLQDLVREVTEPLVVDLYEERPEHTKKQGE